jgi:hypothetical protein
VGSLTGAVSSQTVTEEFKGALNPVGNRVSSVKVEGRLTASPIRRAGAKAGLSDPAVLDGKAVAQQIKGTPGITGLTKSGPPASNGRSRITPLYAGNSVYPSLRDVMSVRDNALGADNQQATRHVHPQDVRAVRSLRD